MRNVFWLGLKEKQQVSILLRLLVVGEEAFLQLGGILQVTCDFVLLLRVRVCPFVTYVPSTNLFQRHAILYKQRYPRVEVSDVFFENEVLFRLRGDFGLELS